MHRVIFLALVFLLVGCATNLKTVRDFADETKKISVGFDPIFAAMVEQCTKKVESKLLYAGKAVKDFSPADNAKIASDTCKPMSDSISTAKGISGALSDYSNKLSAIAGDGVASSVNNNYDALEAKLGGFKDIPQEKLGAVSGLFKFITKAAISQWQRRAIEEALNHEESIGVLGDALVIYTDHVYGGYLKERNRDVVFYADSLRDGSIQAPALLAKLQLIELQKELSLIVEQQKVIPAMQKAVDQMKVSLKDLRSNLDKLTDAQRQEEVTKLAKEVKVLYQQLNKAF